MDGRYDSERELDRRTNRNRHLLVAYGNLVCAGKWVAKEKFVGSISGTSVRLVGIDRSRCFVAGIGSEGRNTIILGGAIYSFVWRNGENGVAFVGSNSDGSFCANERSGGRVPMHGGAVAAVPVERDSCVCWCGHRDVVCGMDTANGAAGRK